MPLQVLMLMSFSSRMYSRSRVGMLRGCWLLTDLDGTLVPTPHKAHGQYLKLSDGPCMHSVKRWLHLGGNVCVITTADRRVFEQVYAPLRPLLPSASSLPTANTSPSPQQHQAGQLLLSVYTGAVLYQGLREGLRPVKEYLVFPHSGLPQQSISHKISERAGPTTCIDHTVCDALFDVMGDIFLAYARDVIFELPAALNSLEHLSKRYRVMWSKLLGYLTAKYHRRVSDTQSAGGITAEQTWKFSFLSSHRHILSRVGIVRREHIKELPAQFALSDTPLSGRSTLAGDGTAANASAVLRSGASDSVHDEFVASTQDLLGVDDASTIGPSVFRGEATHERPVCQMIIVGMPMSVYNSYFASYHSMFAKLGVTAICQPNSVVFSKIGIGKASTVRYLSSASGADPAASGSGHEFAQSVSLRRAVALGDNPHTADHQLTVFRPLQFVSVERDEQRSKRHEAIRIAGHHTAEGHLMDDRLVPNVVHVGGEEHGTSVFLEHLIDEVMRRHQPSGNLVSDDIFQEALAAATALSRAKICGTVNAGSPPAAGPTEKSSHL